MLRVMKRWPRLPREVGAAPSLGTSQARLDGARSTGIPLEMSLPWPQKVPSHPNQSGVPRLEHMSWSHPGEVEQHPQLLQRWPQEVCEVLLGARLGGEQHRRQRHHQTILVQPGAAGAHRNVSPAGEAPGSWGRRCRSPRGEGGWVGCSPEGWEEPSPLPAAGTGRLSRVQGSRSSHQRQNHRIPAR